MLLHGWPYDVHSFADVTPVLASAGYRVIVPFVRGYGTTIVIHNYRWRIGLAAGEPQYDDLERRLAGLPPISVPTITLEGDANGAPHPDGPRCGSGWACIRVSRPGTRMGISGWTFTGRRG
jgi:pimeloyl-ACP methyl ester carboxylesterase